MMTSDELKEEMVEAMKEEITKELDAELIASLRGITVEEYWKQEAMREKVIEEAKELEEKLEELGFDDE